MQPPLLIDWLRKLHLNADSALAEKRWRLARAFAVKVTRSEAIQMIRTFIFSEPPVQAIQSLTSRFLAFDNEFPASNNAEEVRLTAGIVAVAATEENSSFADAFALGIRAAGFPTHRCNAAHVGITDAMAKYLDSKADTLRPSSFSESQDFEKLSAVLLPLASNNSHEQNAAESLASEAAKTLQVIYGNRLLRLSEETAILWWLLGEYSPQLKSERAVLTRDSYALVAAFEAAERTELLPPPPSIIPILTRAVSGCKGPKGKKITLKDVIAATDETWRNKIVALLSAADCLDLVPLITAISKVADGADLSVLGKALPKFCPGVSADLAISEVEAAHQFYNEIIFVKSLIRLG